MNVTLFVSGKKEIYQGCCTRLFPGGMHLKLEGPLPALMMSIRARIKGVSGELEFGCEVVRHVSRTDARAWGMEPGCVLQLLEPTPALLEAIARTMNGGAPPEPAAVIDPEIQHLLRSHWCGEQEDYYLLLGLRPDVELSAARRRARECRDKLEAARTLGLDARDRALVQPAIERVNQAMAVLGDPLQRAEYDAARSNFHGVARCIQAGLTVTDLETCRRRHLVRVPHAPRVASSYVEAARALEQRGQKAEALENYERALALDPLDLKLHLGYARSRRSAA
jgi:tetratricopeptide (TPR) repeat protein